MDANHMGRFCPTGIDLAGAVATKLDLAVLDPYCEAIPGRYSALASRQVAAMR